LARSAPRRCILCGSPGATEEHILAEWTKKYLPSQGTYELVRTGIGGTHRKTAGQLAMVKPRILCRACNERLGREVEERAEAAGLGLMIKPSDGTTTYRLTVEDQRAIATWATKVALFEPYMRVPASSADPRHLADFNTHLRPPQSFAVWLGTYAGKGAYSKLVRRDTQIKVTKTHPPTIYPGEVFTFYVGHALFQVFVGKTTRPHTSRSPDPLQGVMRRIWPPRPSAISWPAHLVNAEGFEFLTHVVPLP
jgi:hypothetical protein